jgi:PTH1 family peptidyl-tRNA hydrolase
VHLIAGLGNPGPRYRGTYHNIGFEVVDELARRGGAAFGSSPADALTARVRSATQDVLLVKPLTFMNLSGRAIGDLQRFYKIDPGDLLVVFDDVHLPPGRLRLRSGGSAGGHNGLKSVIEHVGSDAVPRLRVGVGRGDPQRDLASHVLARVPADEAGMLHDAAILAADAVEVFVASGILEAMNRYNNRGPAQPGDESTAAR